MTARKLHGSHAYRKGYGCPTTGLSLSPAPMLRLKFWIAGENGGRGGGGRYKLFNQFLLPTLPGSVECAVWIALPTSCMCHTLNCTRAHLYLWYYSVACLYEVGVLAGGAASRAEQHLATKGGQGAQGVPGTTTRQAEGHHKCSALQVYTSIYLCAPIQSQPYSHVRLPYSHVVRPDPPSRAPARASIPSSFLSS